MTTITWRQFRVMCTVRLYACEHKHTDRLGGLCADMDYEGEPVVGGTWANNPWDLYTTEVEDQDECEVDWMYVWEQLADWALNTMPGCDSPAHDELHYALYSLRVGSCPVEEALDNAYEGGYPEQVHEHVDNVCLDLVSHAGFLDDVEPTLLVDLVEQWQQAIRTRDGWQYNATNGCWVKGGAK